MREPVESVESTCIMVILHVLGARALSMIGISVGRCSIGIRRFGGVACLTRIIGGRPYVLLIYSSEGFWSSFTKFRNTHAEIELVSVKQRRTKIGWNAEKKPSKGLGENGRVRRRGCLP